MTTAQDIDRQWNERSSAPAGAPGDTSSMFQLLFERTAEAILIFDAEAGVFVDCNPAAVALMRANTKEQLLLTSPVDLSPPFQADGRPSAEASLEVTGLVARNGNHRFEWLARCLDGVDVPMEVLSTAVLVEGRLLHVVVPRDISEQKRAQEEIRRLNTSLEQRVAERTAELTASEARLRTLVEQAPEAIVVFDGKTGRFDTVNENAVQLFGYTREELVRLTPADVSPPFQPNGQTSEEMARENMAAALAGEKPVFEWLHRHSSGRLFTSEVRLVQLPGDRCCLVRASIIDHTERKRAEQALRESEQKFRALFEASSTGVMIHDEQQYLEVNPAVVRMFGYQSAADLVGKNPVITSPPTQLCGRPTAQVAQEHIADCVKNGTARFEWLARHADGSDFPVEVILTRIEMGGRQLMQAVLSNIQERKRAEAELLNALAREQELGQLKSSFVSMVSHEFRTPLAVIQSSAEILDDYFDQLEPAERCEHLRSVQSNTRRMASLMEGVLLIGRLDAGKMEFKPSPMDLRSLTRQIVDEVLSATDRRCPIELSLGALPDEAQVDEALLRHILTNLLTNAVKYSDFGRTVKFDVAREGNDAAFVVRDCGIGIPEADLEWLFQAFHRGRNVADRPGTGLGLVIVKRCADLHGGTVKVASQVGEGTTVSVRLPVFHATPPEKPPS